MKKFIVDLLGSAGRPLSTAEIYLAFDRAGYELTTASIRGRLNSLTYEGRIRRVGFGMYAALSPRLFNLLVSANSKAWDHGSAEIDRSRFLEYTEPEIAERFKSLAPDVLQQLVNLPTLFAYEVGVEKAARVGKLKDVHVRRGSIDIAFEFDEDWPAVESKHFDQIKNSLGFRKNEEYRTHWAIKEVDLYSALIEFGITKNTSPEIELLPTEPPPGPGPQYSAANGKLSEVSSPPTADEATKQSHLHARLREVSRALVRDLERVANRYPELLSSANEYSEILNAASDAIDVVGLWCVGGALAEYARSYRAQNIAKTLSEPLEPQIEAQLQNVVRQHGTFIMGFGEGRNLVARSDEFLIDAARLQEIEESGNALLAELTDNRELVDERTRALHRPVRDSVTEFGWATSRIGYSAYVIVRNGIRAVIKFTVGENPNVSAILSVLTGVSVLAGDANAEFIRAAVPILQQYGSQLLAFFNHSPEMRAYVDWSLRVLEVDREKEG